VYVGKLSSKWVPKLHGFAVLPDEDYIHEIVHPAHILRAGVQNQDYMAQKVTVELTSVFEGVE
jgi:hypothetical protein